MNSRRDTILSEGSVIRVPELGDASWIVSRGWFTSDGCPIYGWYITNTETGETQSLPDRFYCRLNVDAVVSFDLSGNLPQTCPPQDVSFSVDESQQVCHHEAESNLSENLPETIPPELSGFGSPLDPPNATPPEGCECNDPEENNSCNEQHCEYCPGSLREHKLVFINCDAPEENTPATVESPTIAPYTRLEIGDCVIGINGYVAEVCEVEYDKCNLVSLLIAGTGFRVLRPIGTQADFEELERKVAQMEVELSNAMHYIGTATNQVTEGGTQDPGIPGYRIQDAKNGDFVIFLNEVFLWKEGSWHTINDVTSNHLATYIEVANMLNDVFGP